MTTTDEQPLVSLLVPTYNSGRTLDACLASIKKQTYQNIELIVVDNFSTDDTLDIAKRYTEQVHTKGPERSAQRNYCAEIANGEYLLFVDSDMCLDEDVVEQCVHKINYEPELKGLIIPEESFGVGFWAQCKRLERSFYVGVPAVEAARFFRKDTFKQVGGYNDKLIAGEDWDLSDRVEELGALGRIHAFIHHDEGRINLTKTLQKKFYYASNARNYFENTKDVTTNTKRKTGGFGRYFLYFRHPMQLFKNPILGIGMLYMKTLEFAAGGAGLVKSKLS